uniref:BppU_N domain-containing protein n=1 Tax=Strongyloides papillosus TaxID=174720 RepID=A0A0N5C3Y1_STREA
MFSSIRNAQNIRKCVEHGETLHDITLSKEKLIDIPLGKFKEITSEINFKKWEVKGYIPDFNLVTFNIEGTKKASIFHK